MSRVSLAAGLLTGFHSDKSDLHLKSPNIVINASYKLAISQTRERCANSRASVPAIQDRHAVDATAIYKLAGTNLLFVLHVPAISIGNILPGRL